MVKNTELEKINALMIDDDTERCSLRSGEFATEMDFGKAQSRFDMKGESTLKPVMAFHVCLVSAEGCPAPALSELISALEAFEGECRGIVTEAPHESEEILRYIETGAWDYVEAGEGLPVLLRKIRAAVKGKTLFCSNVAEGLIERR